MIATDALVAGVELGGTKCIAVLAKDGLILKREQWPTGLDSIVTLALIERWLEAEFDKNKFAAIGIASFGPLCLDPTNSDFGRIISTPKPGWSGTDVLHSLAGKFRIPIGFDTDVAGAALAEGRWGASIGCDVHAYVTMGTGIGAGIVVQGKVLHGRVHPEIGHIRVRRSPGDEFVGICPFHGDCLEGLASGPAIAARVGKSANILSEDDPVWELVGTEVGELMSILILTLSPQRIVIGGGVGQGQPSLLQRIHAATARLLGGYLPGQTFADLEQIIVPAKLGADAGSYGAVAVALSKLEI